MEPVVVRQREKSSPMPGDVEERVNCVSQQPVKDQRHWISVIKPPIGAENVYRLSWDSAVGVAICLLLKDFHVIPKRHLSDRLVPVLFAVETALRHLDEQLFSAD